MSAMQENAPVAIHNNTTTTAAGETPAVELPATTAAAPSEPVVEPTPITKVTGPVEVDPVNPQAGPIVPKEESAKEKSTGEGSVKDETTPAKAEEEVNPASEKKVELITSGTLAYKGPGLLKSLIPSKKDFWLSHDAVSPQAMNSFMRGDKPEVANPIVAWASQTGQGLLFFNKKGNTSRASPEGVLALYDAFDIKKSAAHDITFKIGGHEHTLKASTDTERDGWYESIKQSAEAGKALKGEIRESEGYKAEMEKLNKPNVSADTPKAKKSGEAERTEQADKKKSRSASRGLVDRFKAKKEESEVKKEDKKEDKKDEPLATETNEEEPRNVEPVEDSHVVAPVAVANSDEMKDETALPVHDKTEKSDDKPEEKSKAAKRTSIFGRMSSGFTSMRSPAKEKDHKDAELKPDVPPKDDAVAESAPQIPRSSAEPTEPIVVDTTNTQADDKPEEGKEDKKNEAATPAKEKKGFLSGLSFMKRDRSVSPSQTAKSQPKPESEAVNEDAPEPTKAEEPTPETSTTAAEPAENVEPKPEEAVEETPKDDKAETSTPNKRQSVLGSLGRRASKAFKGMQTPKKENAAPKTETKEEPSENQTAVETPVTNGETTKETSQEPQQIGDVVPNAIDAGKPQESTPPTVTASA